MTRRELLRRSAALTVAAALTATARRAACAAAAAAPLTPPADGTIDVAFLISRGAVVIDFCGPWEVFSGVSLPGRSAAPFRLYTVAESQAAVSASGGLQVVPNFTFASAPPPRIIVIPAQDGAGDAALAWLRRASAGTDLTMSVCTGAFVLARTGLLDGKAATTHHGAYTQLAMQFPQVEVRRGARFVETGNLASAGGLSSGIDLALRVVERYYGRDVARQTAFDMEYQGEGWTNPDSNAVYARAYTQSDEHPVCPVCGMAVDRASAPKSVYKGQTY